MNFVALDTETDLMAAGNVIPNFVCATTAARVGDGLCDTKLITNGDANVFEFLEWLITDEDVGLVFHNAAFDMTVIAKAYPVLIPAIFKAYVDDRVFCTQIREKLLQLSTTGDLKFMHLPDGSARPLDYKLVTLETKYLGIERNDQKEGEDIWRLHFVELSGLPAAEYPAEATEYAIADAVGTLKVFEAQEARANLLGAESMVTQEIQVRADFALKLMTGWGLLTDPVAKAEIEAMLARELVPDKLNLLVEYGVLRPGKPSRAHKTGARHHDGTLKMTKGKKESINKKVLGDIVMDVCKQHGLALVPTDKTRNDEFPKPSTAAAVMVDLAPLSPVLEQYQHRAKLQKLITTELPRMGVGGGTVHPEFDVIKETSRTSSYASKLYPSLSIQNIDYRVRNCFIPRPGWVILSSDYSSVELACLAQKLFALFGQSRLRDLINNGHDAHAYLGAVLAFNLHEGFRDSCIAEEIKSEEDIYLAFLRCKTSTDPKVEAFFKHWRKFAKPTGLGFPGGLGPKTFVTYAKATFDVTVTEQMAYQLREIWHSTYPEMRPYFEWITDNCQDPQNPEAYAYTTPLGAYRAGATYCAACNGAALQSPAAEGGKIAAFDLQRACYDPTANSCLLGCHCLGFVHDEFLVEIPHDKFMHERSCEVVRIMVEAMSTILPDVLVQAEPALMLRWDKKAESVFDENNRLTIWTPNN